MIKKLLPVLHGLCLLLLFLLPSGASATTLTVDPNADSCTPPCYTSITSALNAADADLAVDLIILEPAVYSVSTSIPLRSGVSLQGRETARTILSGTGGNTIITADAIGAATVVRNLTFTNASVGIDVLNSTQLDIANNVFRLPGGTGISTSASAATAIVNNTFHDVGTAISTSTDTTLNIINNIFSSYTTSFPDSTVIDSGGVLNNLFTGAAGDNVDTVTNGNIVSSSPLFVDVNAGDAGDFHLQDGSPAIDAGNASAGNDAVDGTTPDIGAYGGGRSDTIPFPVSDLFVSGSTADSITVSWSTSTPTDYRLAGYNVYYGTLSGTYDNGPLDAGIGTTHTIPGLTSASGPTTAPVLSWSIANQTIDLAWLPAEGATGYEVRYGVGTDTPLYPPADDPGALDVGNTVIYQLNGLTNGTNYNIIVVPYAEAVYFIIVKAYYVQTDPDLMSAASNVAQESIGSRALGLQSNLVSDYPEAIAPQPNLPNTGCFIATAAYGSDSSSPVRALRMFRDRYLMTNAAGQAFVRWYYTYGPAGARFLNDHPALKPVVRAMLLPAAGGAMFLTRATSLEKTLAVMMLLMALPALAWDQRRRKADRRGMR